MKKCNLLITIFCCVVAFISLYGQQHDGGNKGVTQIDQGRLLFVLNDLIDATTLSKVYNKPLYFSSNPIVKADKKWELNADGDPYAAPFSGGVWYDEMAKKYKMWYSAGGGKSSGLVVDQD